MEEDCYDVLIIGCGAVGAAVAREMTLIGQKCILLEKNIEVLSEASSGNTGHLARNFHYTAQRAPLEFQMTRRAATKHNQEWLDSQPNVPRRRCGLLMVATNEEEFNTITDMEVKARANGEDVRIIKNKHELFKLEPHLALNEQDFVAALYSPEEYVVDPFLLPLSNLYVALKHGCTLETRCRVIDVSKDDGETLWKVTAEKRTFPGGKSSQVFLRAAKVINCAGNYSDEIDFLVPRSSQERKHFTIKPGRGEYVVLEPSKNRQDGPMGMVTQVPSKTYAGLYMFRSVYGHYVVGPTNVIQDCKQDRGCNVENVADLLEFLVGHFPALKDCKMLGVYAGLRPHSPESHDYQIRFNADKTWATLGAIRSTGLTASRAIAEYCASKMFNGNYEQMARKPDVIMPEAEPLVNGLIKVGDFTFKPTHKLTQVGLSKLTTRVSNL